MAARKNHVSQIRSLLQPTPEVRAPVSQSQWEGRSLISIISVQKSRWILYTTTPFPLSLLFHFPSFTEPLRTLSFLIFPFQLPVSSVQIGVQFTLDSFLYCNCILPIKICSPHFVLFCLSLTGKRIVSILSMAHLRKDRKTNNSFKIA